MAPKQFNTLLITAKVPSHIPVFQYTYILAVVAFVENEFQLKKYLAIRKDLPNLKAIVQWGGTVPQEKDVYSWKDFLELGQKTPEEEVLKIMQELKPTKCCTLIYTSGTTGPPKAVMLSNDNITWTAQAAGGFLHVSNTDRMVSYLPLSHIAAQMVDLHIPIAFCKFFLKKSNVYMNLYLIACTTYFAQPDALKGSLAVTLKAARPTLFLGVPRVWEKMHEKMLEIGKNNGGLKKNIADWAKHVGLKGAYAKQEGKSKPWGGWLANALVYSKVREALGLDQARVCGSAAAPIAKETLEYFYSLGIPIYEIYGMSESTGPQTVDTPWAYKIGTVGKTFDGNLIYW
jgi:long-chain-fatty-acid--CoA ligase ACSBG